MSKIMTAPDFKFLCKKAGLEVGLDNHLHLKLGPAHLPHQGNHPERQRDVLGGAVPEHQRYNTVSKRVLILRTWSLIRSFLAFWVLIGSLLIIQGHYFNYFGFIHAKNVNSVCMYTN